MAYHELSVPCEGHKTPPVTIMVFLEGTVFKTLPILHRFSVYGYRPAGKSIALLENWAAQGAKLVFCTYLRKNRLPFILAVVRRYPLGGERLYYRSAGEQYAQLIEQATPDILIEDDCKSIGGARQMCITGVSDRIKEQVHSIVVPEFLGLDELPCELEKLLCYVKKAKAPQ